ncbi:MAG TPA: galactose oxidase-like domain-containing protein [Candidatus Binatia bacterium]|nr:galactose oxidase-like domain-containing protein [Candidatus Binatia bacterium]
MSNRLPTRPLASLIPPAVITSLLFTLLATAIEPWAQAHACESPGNVPASVDRRNEREVAAALKKNGGPSRLGPRALPPEIAGQWQLVAGDSEILSVHAALLPTGKVLYMAGSGNDHNYRSGINEARLFDPHTQAVSGWPDFPGARIPAGDPPTLHDNDVFCAGHSHLPDGRLLVVGGNLEYPTGWVHRTPGVAADLLHGAGEFDHPLPYDNPEVERPACHGFLGLRDSFLFDAATSAWTRGPKMTRGRWYPTTLALRDGRVLAINGFDDVGRTGCRAVGNRTVELFDPQSESWGAPIYYPPAWPDDRYPYLHLLPSGQVFYAGPSAATRAFEPETLTTVGSVYAASRGYRDYGSSTLLPLRPQQAYRARVLNAGGVQLFGQVPTQAAEIIDLSQPAPAWQSAAPMLYARVDAPSVLLPDGKLLVIGGSAIRETMGQGVLEAETFDPDANSWASAGSSSVERHYHSVALLLPDATVWVSGGNPRRSSDVGPDPDVATGPCSAGEPCHPDPFDGHGNNELRMEIYSPAYLFAGPRPQIASADESAAYGGILTVTMTTAQEAASVDHAVLVRLGSSTHARNMDQRLVELVAVARPGAAGTTLSFAAPPHAALAPPGYYMLFLLSAQGVPSTARFVRLRSASDCDAFADLDGDGIGDACDDADSAITIDRVSLAMRDAAAVGRVRVAGIAAGPLDTSAGLAIRVQDGMTLDVAAALSPQECAPCGHSCRRCRSENGAVRVKLRTDAGGTRFVARMQDVAVSPISGARIYVTLTTAPALAVQGIDARGQSEECTLRSQAVTCR